jgi:hypothetical protein
VASSNPPVAMVTRTITISGDMALNITLQRTAACPRIGFDDLSPHAARFTSYTVCGFTVASTMTNWTVSTTFGRPAPFIQFTAPGGTTAVGEVLVTASGATFRFSSVDVVFEHATDPLRNHRHRELRDSVHDPEHAAEHLR